jgi:hypothetical protein
VLDCGLPYLLYTKIQTTTQETVHKVTCADIIRDWGSLIKERRQLDETILFMDNYYLSKEGREWLNKNKVKFIAMHTRN